MSDRTTKLFDNLKSGILGTQSARIDKEIDSSIQSIETYSSKMSQNRYVEALRDLVKTSGADDQDNMLQQFQGSQANIETYDHSGRIQRYAEYDAILTKISYCDRALNVLTDNIISPDDITKRSITIVKETDEADVKQHQDKLISQLKQIEKSIDLERHIHGMVKKVLKKGDLFLEILHSPKGENALTILQEDASDKTPKKENPPETHKLIQEMGNPIDVKINLSGEPDKEDDDENKVKEVLEGKILIETISFGGALTGMGSTSHGMGINTSTGRVSTSKPYSPNLKSKDAHETKGLGDEPLDDEDKFISKFNKNDENSNLAELKDIFVSIHDPKFIIKLETERFRSCLGYLVFPKVDPATLAMGSLASADNAVDQLCRKILDQIETKLRIGGKDELSLSSELKNTLRQYLNTLQHNDDLKIRYVAPEMMTHWRINVDRFYPYGESIFEVVRFDCNLLMAMKTATTIKRLTSAIDKRFINIETGLPRDAKNLVEMVREGMRKRKISVDSFGSIDSIPSLIPVFEDIYIPMRDGKKFVEFDHQQWGQNPSDDIEPLKFMRDNIVANLGVPAPFLGLEENTCFPSYTKIPLLEGYSVDLGSLITQYEKDPDNFNQWTYSIDPETNKVVPGRILKAMETRQNAELVRVHLDNGSYEDCTPDHLWMLRDGTYCEAQNLKEFDSLMPWYIRASNVKTRNNTPYMQIYNPGTRRWQVIHRMVSENTNKLVHGDRKQIHHIDENPLNNHPDNLVALTGQEHFEQHKKFRYNPKTKQPYALTETRNCCICNIEFECRVQSNQTTCLSPKCMTERKRLDGHKSWERKKKLSGTDYNMVTATCVVCGKEFETYQKYLDEKTEKWITCGNYECGRIITGKRNTHRVYGDNETIKLDCVICGKEFEIGVRQEHLTNTCSITCMNTVLARRRQSGNRQSQPCSFCGTEISTTKYQRDNNRYIPCGKKSCKSMKQGVELYLKKNPDKTIDDYINSKQPLLNHKVVRVEHLTNREDCGDLEIEKYHNFALSSGVFVHNSNRALLSVENIVFARTIIGFQKELSIFLKELFEKIYRLTHSEDLDLLDNIKITFPEPKVSPYEHEMEYVEQMQRLIEAYKALGVPEVYLKKKYLPGLDWGEIDKYKAEQILKQELGTEDATEDDGMGGMGGASMGGMGGF